MLPTLVEPETAAELAELATEITDLAQSLIEMGELDAEFSAELSAHLAAVKLAGELCWTHDPSHPAADADLCHAAAQLRFWHLEQLDLMLATND